MAEYIEKEAVVRYLKGYSEKELNSMSPYGMITSSVLNKVERAISEIPAADVQIVRRGKWVDMELGELYKCSVCRRIINFEKVDFYNFCPQCGADLREDNIKNSRKYSS